MKFPPSPRIPIAKQAGPDVPRVSPVPHLPAPTWPVVAALFATAALAGCGNQGADTKCSDFLTMSRSEREAVIRKSGYSNPPLSTVASQARDAAVACEDQPADETIEYALGP